MSDKHRPRWVAAKEPLTCEQCHKAIARFEKVFLIPKKKTFYCVSCGRKAAEIEERREAAEEATPTSVQFTK